MMQRGSARVSEREQVGGPTDGKRTAKGLQARSISTRAELLDGAARVFSRLTFAEARLKDVAAESGISAGSMYFHFGKKDDLARAILHAQQERMTLALTDVLEQQRTGLDSLLEVTRRLALLIASDVIVQAGIKLSAQPGTGLEPDAKHAYFGWIDVAASLIRRGIEDGSIRPTVDAAGAAEFVNVVFVGAQVLSELEDSWASLPARLVRMEQQLIEALSSIAPTP